MTVVCCLDRYDRLVLIKACRARRDPANAGAMPNETDSVILRFRINALVYKPFFRELHHEGDARSHRASSKPALLN